MHAVTVKPLVARILEDADFTEISDLAHLATVSHRKDLFVRLSQEHPVPGMPIRFSLCLIRALLMASHEADTLEALARRLRVAVMSSHHEGITEITLEELLRVTADLKFKQDVVRETSATRSQRAQRTLMIDWPCFEFFSAAPQALDELWDILDMDAHPHARSRDIRVMATEEHGVGSRTERARGPVLVGFRRNVRNHAAETVLIPFLGPGAFMHLTLCFLADQVSGDPGEMQMLHRGTFRNGGLRPRDIWVVLRHEPPPVIHRNKRWLQGRAPATEMLLGVPWPVEAAGEDEEQQGLLEEVDFEE